MYSREIQELYSGTLPRVRVQTECRCQASHPRVKPLMEHYCIANGVDDADNDAMLRLNSEAHNLEFVNDGDSNTYWISQFQNNIELTIDLQDDFQVNVCMKKKWAYTWTGSTKSKWKIVI